ncbi:MAG: hypothetical protein ACK559_34855 [bacterium]
MARCTEVDARPAWRADQARARSRLSSPQRMRVYRPASRRRAEEVERTPIA